MQTGEQFLGGIIGLNTDSSLQMFGQFGQKMCFPNLRGIECKEIFAEIFCLKS